MKACGIILALAGLGAVQDAKPDKFGKDKPPSAAKRFLAELSKRKGAAVAEQAIYSVGPQKVTSSFEGVFRKDLAAVKGTFEIYAKGAHYIVNSGGRFDPPESFEGREAVGPLSFKNPSLLFDELGRVAASASFGGDEDVEGVDCKVIDFVADPATLKGALKDLGDRFNRAFGGNGPFGGVQIFDFKNALDEKGSMATYRACVGKADLNLYRLEFVLRPKVKPNVLPPQFRLPEDFDQRWDLKFSKWDDAPAPDLPAPAKAKLKVP
jgi:hypothetical protein